MNFFLLIFALLLAFATIGMLVVFYFVHRGIRFFRRFSNDSMSDEEFQRMANKYYRSPRDADQEFDSDYFKGSGRQQGGGTASEGRQRPRRSSSASSGGVIVEDHRTPEQARKKIFASDEGEYVDFKES